jgi:hypothetical protein
MRRFSALVVLVFLLCSCSRNIKQGDKNIVGKWEIVYMSETGGKELPHGIWIEFFDDGSFSSYDARDAEITSGTWAIEKNNSMLLLKNESDVQDINEWKLNVSGSSMSWTGMKDYETENLKIKFTKIVEK